MFKFTVTAILLAGLIQQAFLAPTLDSTLVQRLKAGQSANVLVSMKEGTTTVLDQLQSRFFGSRADRLNAVASSLKSFTNASQKNVVEFLSKEQSTKSFSFRPLWITNKIILRNADLEVIQQLAAMSDVSSISEEHIFPLEEPLDLVLYDNLPPANEEETQWGVKQIQAPQVWAGGNKGEKVIICTIDTGVRGTHEALKDNYRKEYGWYDPVEHTAEPNDRHGHGTHTTGTIVGRTRNIGVAPEAQWIACKGCATDSCSDFDLFECAEFVACPFDTNGENPDCSKAPHLVSNSWGAGRGNMWYEDPVKAWRTAGIIPLFSQGNSGPACGSVGSPGDYENVIGVGSTTILNTLSYFSSAGPTLIGARMKPDIAAPGSNIFSAYYLSDTSYSSMSGTSMSCPHAAGTVALLMAEAKKVDAEVVLSFDQVYESLRRGGQLAVSSGKNCDGVPEETLPNHHVGHGRIDAHLSVGAVQRILKF